MTAIDKDIVKRSFGVHADKYDSLAHVQKTVCSKLINLLKIGSEPPARLLDIGSGTGVLIEQLGKLYPETLLQGIDLAFGMTQKASARHADNVKTDFVCGDAEKLPFKDNSFNLAVSTSTYQWIFPLDGAFSEVIRILEPGSSFIFALFGENTLFELKESYKKALSETGSTKVDRTHRFASLNEVSASMKSAGFSKVEVFDEIEIERHPDVPSMLRSLKGIGAGNASRGDSNGLSGRAEMLRMMELYKTRYGSGSGIQATYHVIYGKGIK